MRKPIPEGSSVDEEGNRFFAEEGSAEGCASGECLPEPGAPTEPAPEKMGTGCFSPPEKSSLSPFPARPSASAPAAKPFLPSAGTPNAEKWRHAVDSVRHASARHGASLANGRLLWLRPGETIDIGIGFPSTAQFHRTTVSASAGRAMIEEALAEHFRRPVKLTIESADDIVQAAAPSLAEVDAQDRETHTRTTDAKVRSHPAVRATLRFLGGEIEHIQVYEKPRAQQVANASEGEGESDES